MTNWTVRLGIPVLSAAIGCAALFAQAPDPSGPPDQGNAPAVGAPPADPDIGPAILDFVPPALAQLGAQAVARESFTLDRTLLAAAAGMLPDSDADLRQTIARLDGVSVHMLRFTADGSADPGQIQAIR